MSLTSRLFEQDAGTIDRLARRAIESGRDWRGPEQLTVASPAPRRGKPAVPPAIPAPGPFCTVTDVMGYRFCFACSGNDYLDTPFTCGEVQ